MLLEPLTIALPTRGRLGNLHLVLARVLDEIDASVRIVVLDNGGDAAADLYVHELRHRHPQRLEIVTHSFDCGRNGNYMRCFEVCQTRWLYILGDSKLPVPGFLQHIRAEIAAQPDACMINFVGMDENLAGRARLVCRGVTEFVEKMDSLGNTNLLGALVFNTEKVNPHCHVGYTFGITYVPYLAAGLVALGDKGIGVYSDRRLIEAALPQPHGSQWNGVDVNFGLAALGHLPVPTPARRMLLRKVNDPAWGATQLSALLLAMLGQAIAAPAERRALGARYRLIVRMRNYLEGGFRSVAPLVVGWLAFLWPGLSYRLLEARRVGWRASFARLSRRLQNGAGA